MENIRHIMVQNSQESRCKYWATCLSVHAHCSLIRLLAHSHHSLPTSRESEPYCNHSKSNCNHTATILQPYYNHSTLDAGTSGRFTPKHGRIFHWQNVGWQFSSRFSILHFSSLNVYMEMMPIINLDAVSAFHRFSTLNCMQVLPLLGLIT